MFKVVFCLVADVILWLLVKVHLAKGDTAVLVAFLLATVVCVSAFLVAYVFGPLMLLQLGRWGWAMALWLVAFLAPVVWKRVADRREIFKWSARRR